MFDKSVYYCPRCGFEVREDLRDGQEYACGVCRTRYAVLLDEARGQAAFAELEVREIPEPLHLPRGSIRALVSLALAGACWALIFLGREAPDALLSLLLTILGYYFGFRSKVRSRSDRIHDVRAARSAPLFLPAGAIRAVLILGFLAAGGALLARGRLGEMPYLEFFAMLGGLIAGHLFGRVLAKAEGGSLHLVLHHAGGAVVLALAAVLVVLLLSGLHEAVGERALTLLCALVSFYFGSRT